MAHIVLTRSNFLYFTQLDKKIDNQSYVLCFKCEAIDRSIYLDLFIYIYLFIF